mmetsp:Transcript_38629/g.70278  ORF Transcript_38629/g.70278 Transcript_38629/m.70278 type:complete len:540 (+) Transcript_38629:91-1710(+)
MASRFLAARRSNRADDSVTTRGSNDDASARGSQLRMAADAGGQYIQQARHNAVSMLRNHMESVIYGTKKAEEDQTMEDVAETIKKYRLVGEDEVVEEKWVDRAEMDLLMSFVILCNTVTVGLEVDYGDDTTELKVLWILLEAVFCIIFVVELGLKLWAHSVRWIIAEPLNVVTTTVAIMSVVDLCILTPLGTSGTLRLFSLLRVVGLTRLLRLIRDKPQLKALKLVFQGLLNNLRILFWTVALLTVVLFISAIFTTRQIGHNTEVYGNYKKLSGGWDHEEFFGTVGRSMLTLIQVLTLDMWSSEVARHVLTNQPAMALFFLIFLVLTTYGLLSLVVGVIVEQTLAATKQDEAKARVREEKARRQELATIEKIFEMADAEHTGELTLAAFTEAMTRKEVRWRMQQLELHASDMQRLFQVMDGDGTCTLTMKEFINGCMKMKGQALSKDMLALQAQADTLSGRLDDLGFALQRSEKMMAALDEITNKMFLRVGPTMVASRQKINQTVGGTQPIVPISPKQHTAPLSIGNRPALPLYPNLVE